MIKRNQQRCSFLLFFSITERNNEKFEIFHQNVWNIQKYSLYLPRQKVTFGYPGKFPERASRIRHYPFKSHLRVVFYFLKLFIIIRRKPLLVARLRFTDIVFLPVNIKTSEASDDISKYLFISVVRFRTLYTEAPSWV